MISSVHGSSLPILPRELCWRNSSNAGSLKRRGQPWRAILVSKSFLVNPVEHPCRILANLDRYVYFSKDIVQKLFISSIFVPRI